MRQTISISKLVRNEGQIPGVPQNPRVIKDRRYQKLLQSIKDDPEMLDLREIIVFPLGKIFVAIGGNMRLTACQELGFKELPCKVLPADTPPEKLRAYVIKDNVSYGEDDDDLLTEWDDIELDHWGATDIETDYILPTGVKGEKQRIEDAEITDYGSKNREIDVEELNETIEVKFNLDRHAFVFVRDVLLSKGRDINEGLVNLCIEHGE